MAAGADLEVGCSRMGPRGAAVAAGRRNAWGSARVRRSVSGPAAPRVSMGYQSAAGWAPAATAPQPLGGRCAPAVGRRQVCGSPVLCSSPVWLERRDASSPPSPPCAHGGADAGSAIYMYCTAGTHRCGTFLSLCSCAAVLREEAGPGLAPMATARVRMTRVVPLIPSQLK